MSCGVVDLDAASIGTLMVLLSVPVLDKGVSNMLLLFLDWWLGGGEDSAAESAALATDD
jgi:hypothetical protein